VVVTAETDCIVWYLPEKELRDLRRSFPMECRLLDKVAVEHIKQLQAFAPTISDAAVFRNADKGFLRELRGVMENHTRVAGDVVIQEGGFGDGLWFIARGRATVRRASEANGTAADAGCEQRPSIRRRRDSKERRTSMMLNGLSLEQRRNSLTLGVVVGELTAGECFGELAALGFEDRHAYTVCCETTCDLRYLPAQAMVDVCAAYPGHTEPFLKMAAEHGHTYEPATGSLEDMDLLEIFSMEFKRRLDEEMSRIVLFRGQAALHENVNESFYILEKGLVTVEIDKARIIDMEAPMLLGEMGVLSTGFKSTTTIRCSGICTMRVAKVSTVRALLKLFPEDKRNLERVANLNTEELRAILLEHYHGQNLSVVAACQQGSDSPTGPDLPERKRLLEKREKRPDAVPKKGVVFRGTEAAQHSARDEHVTESEIKAAAVCLQEDTIFKESDPRFLDYVAAGMKKAIFFPDQVILLEGEEGDYAVLIQRGEATVEVGDVRVGEVRAGGLLGEGVLLGKTAKRTATVRAVGLVSAFTIAQAMILDAFEEFPAERERLEHLQKLRNQTNKALTGNDEDPSVQSDAAAVKKDDSKADLSASAVRRHSVRPGGPVHHQGARRSSRLVGGNPPSSHRFSALGAAAVLCVSKKPNAESCASARSPTLDTFLDVNGHGPSDEDSGHGHRLWSVAKTATARESGVAGGVHERMRELVRGRSFGTSLANMGTGKRVSKPHREPNAPVSVTVNIGHKDSVSYHEDHLADADHHQNTLNFPLANGGGAQGRQWQTPRRQTSGGVLAGAGKKVVGARRTLEKRGRDSKAMTSTEGHEDEDGFEEEDAHEDGGEDFNEASFHHLQILDEDDGGAADGSESSTPEPAGSPHATSGLARDQIEWARRRQEAIREANLRRDLRLVKSGQLMPIVPRERGCSPRSKGPAKSMVASRLRVAAASYKRPVWHEIFGKD
jgi:CRP-like cAMP-binding protein